MDDKDIIDILEEKPEKRRYITKTGTVYIHNGSNWERHVQKNGELSIEYPKDAFYVSCATFDKIRAEKNRKLLETAKKTGYQGKKGLVLFLDNENDWKFSSEVVKIEPSFS